MKKQLSFISLALVMSIFSYSMFTPNRAYAGKDVPPGVPIDGPGKEVPPGVPTDGLGNTPPVAPAPGTNVQVEVVTSAGGTPTVVITAPPAVQAALNTVFATAINQIATTSPIISVLQGNVEASNQLVSSIVILGASPATVTALVTALSGLQTGGIVNINNLNAAITALTQLLNESSPEALAALANDPNFRAVVNLLRQLRVAVGQS